MTTAVHVLDTGCANLASMQVAMRALGARWVDAQEPELVREADHVILPGVGSFEAGMRALEDRGWVEPLRERIEKGRSTLAVCLGLQLLTRGSEECPGRAGVGALPANVIALRGARPLPHMGWNDVRLEGSSEVLPAYFANSFAISADDADDLREAGWKVATTRHGGDFVSMLRRDRVLACQFHPELSGEGGRRLLAEWLDPRPAVIEWAGTSS